MSTGLIKLAKTLMEDVFRNLENIQPGQLMYYKQILMYALYALGYAVDALVSHKLGTRPTGHGERLSMLLKIGREDIRKMYEQLIVLVFSKLETLSSLSVDNIKEIVRKINEKIEEIEHDIKK